MPQRKKKGHAVRVTLAPDVAGSATPTAAMNVLGPLRPVKGKGGFKSLRLVVAFRDIPGQARFDLEFRRTDP